jgi:acyl-CoA synthetase (AMP-forming)/AMP-acid ligase II
MAQILLAEHRELCHVIVDGETIAGGELEEYPRAHPAISSAAVVALPDRYLGEKICAAVVFTGDPANLSELNDYLDHRGVAKHAHPMCWPGWLHYRPPRSARSTRRRLSANCRLDRLVAYCQL